MFVIMFMHRCGVSSSDILMCKDGCGDLNEMRKEQQEEEEEEQQEEKKDRKRKRKSTR